MTGVLELYAPPDQQTAQRGHQQSDEHPARRTFYQGYGSQAEKEQHENSGQPATDDLQGDDPV